MRSYYAYLDQKSAFISSEAKKFKKGLKPPLLEELIKLQAWQSMLDSLLQVRPLDENIKVCVKNYQRLLKRPILVSIL